MPPTPNAMSIANEPVGMVSTCMCVASPKRMIEPSPKRLVMLPKTASNARARPGSISDFLGAAALAFLPLASSMNSVSSSVLSASDFFLRAM